MTFSTKDLFTLFYNSCSTKEPAFPRYPTVVFLAVACCQKPVSFGSKRERKNERKRTFWIAFLNWTVEWSLFKIKRAGNTRLRSSNCRCFGWETFLFFTVPVEWKEGLVSQESKDYFLLPLPIKFIYEILHSWAFPDRECVTIQFPEQKACVGFSIEMERLVSFVTFVCLQTRNFLYFHLK